MPVALQKQIELMVFGGLIIFFLIVEPHGLARLWQIAKEKLRLWPFPTSNEGGAMHANPRSSSDRRCWPSAVASGPLAAHRARPRPRRSSSRCWSTAPGPYAPSGIPIANGFVDYFTLINERDGGINGVKVAWEECETQYDTKQGVECYERLKGKSAGAGEPVLAPASPTSSSRRPPSTRSWSSPWATA